MLSIFISLTGTGERTESKLLLAWFGSRGLASVVFAIIVLNSGVAAAGTLAMTVVCRVSMSIFTHDLTANPLASALGARIERLKLIIRILISTLNFKGLLLRPVWSFRAGNTGQLTAELNFYSHKEPDHV